MSGSQQALLLYLMVRVDILPCLYFKEPRGQVRVPALLL
jgi:hypothetical protein